MKKELEETKAAKSGDAITKGALQLRNDIKKQDVSQVWPPDMENSVSVIPESVTLLARDGVCGKPSERVRRLATSFGSDLFYDVTCEKTKPPKHILAVKFVTGYAELYKFLIDWATVFPTHRLRKSTQHYVYRSWNAQLMMCLFQETYIYLSLSPWLGAY